MLQIFDDIHPVVLDVTLISLLVLIVFFGVLRGIKKNIFDLLILSVSIFLGFSSYTQVVKDVFTKKILNLPELVPAGSSNLLVFLSSMFNNLVSSLCVLVLIYLVMSVLRSLFGMLIRKRRGEEHKPKSKVGRVIAGFLSFVYGSVVLVFALHTLNSNVVGMNALVEQTSVVKVVAEKSEALIDNIGEKFFKQKRLTDKVVLKIHKGDFMAVIDNEFVASFDYVDGKINEIFGRTKYLEILEDSELTETEAKEISKERINDLNNAAILAKNFNENPDVKNKFSKLAEEWLTVINRKITGDELGILDFTLNERGKIRINLAKAGLSEDLLKLFDEITV